jgi:hypothetical protein
MFRLRDPSRPVSSRRYTFSSTETPSSVRYVRDHTGIPSRIPNAYSIQPGGPVAGIAGQVSPSRASRGTYRAAFSRAEPDRKARSSLAGFMAVTIAATSAPEFKRPRGTMPAATPSPPPVQNFIRPDGRSTSTRSWNTLTCANLIWPASSECRPRPYRRPHSCRQVAHNAD